MNEINKIKIFSPENMKVHVMWDAMIYYEKFLKDKYVEIDSIPMEMIGSTLFKKITPEQFIQSCFILRLDLSYEFEWRWIAKLALCLPLPPTWVSVIENTY